MRSAQLCVWGFMSAFLGGCSATDFQLEPRAEAINQGTDFARNNEILLNIVRASRSQPLNFVPISKASGTQTTDLKVGLPTLTLGPEQTAMQRQVAFGGNTWDNSSSGSFDSAPLATRDFYTNMLSPIDLQTANALIRQGFSRELVFDAVIGSIRMKERQTGRVIEVINDPALDPVAECPPAGDVYGPGPGHIANSSHYAPEALSNGSNLAQCPFHLFEFLMQVTMKWGLSIETKTTPNPAYTPDAVKQAKAAGKDAPAKTITSSHFCFDPAFADKAQEDRVLRQPDACGSKKEWSSSGEGQDLFVVFAGGGRQSQAYTFTIIPRSPFAMFRYFGRVLRAEETTPVRLYWHDGGLSDADDRILSVSRSVLPSCFAKTFYFGQYYCVPYEGSDATKQVFNMLNQVVALSTTTGSLPTTLEVRLQ
jgi:hypothetical protein